jgi:hypothetical protein
VPESCQGDYPDQDDDWCECPDDDDGMEPVGSCEECGVNLYKDDDPELCEQCLWREMLSRGEIKP